MSWRTWVGTGHRDWADGNLADHLSIADLAKSSMWHLPAKMATDNPSLALEFLTVMDREYAMAPIEFSSISIEGKPEIYGPSWREVCEYLGVRMPDWVIDEGLMDNPKPEASAPWSDEVMAQISDEIDKAKKA